MKNPLNTVIAIRSVLVFVSSGLIVAIFDIGGPTAGELAVFLVLNMIMTSIFMHLELALEQANKRTKDTNNAD